MTLITDLQQLTSYVETLDDQGMYEVVILQRNKYVPNLTAGKGKGKVLNSAFLYKNKIVEYLQDLDGAFSKYSGSIGCYITNNSLDKIEGLREMLEGIAKQFKMQVGHRTDPITLAQASMLKTRGKRFVDFDFDNKLKPSDVCWDGINLDAVKFILTTNGFHALIDTNAAKDRTAEPWYHTITHQKLHDADRQAHFPLAGCIQGVTSVTWVNAVDYFAALQ